MPPSALAGLEAHERPSRPAAVKPNTSVRIAPVGAASREEAHAVEAADRMLGRHARRRSTPARLDAGTPTSARRMPSGSLNVSTSRRSASRRLVGDALLDEAVRPVADRAFRHAEHRLLRLPDAEPARARLLPGEEGQDRAGLAGLVAVIEVIGAWIVEVDGLLDQPQAERPGVEIEVPARGARDAGDVMDAGCASWDLPSGRRG